MTVVFQLAISTLATVDPCAPVEPLATADLRTAAAYRRVAEHELWQGDEGTAAAAFAAALRHDPGDASARQALGALCARKTAPDPFDAAVRLMDAGGLPPRDQEALAGHSWPGNVRELENALERALILAGEDEVSPEHLRLGGARAYAGDTGSLLRDGFNLDALYSRLESLSQRTDGEAPE